MIPMRKRMRLQNYDYSSLGVYFITICVKNKHAVLGTVVENALARDFSVKNVDAGDFDVEDAFAGDAVVGDAVVGDAVVGDAVLSVPPPPPTPHVKLSNIGKIVDAYLSQMNNIQRHIKLVNYVIMPNHVHLLIELMDEGREEEGTLRTASPTTASPTTAPPTTALPTAISPMKATIPRIVRGMKSATSRKIGFSIWQRSYHDHIIRNEADYRRIWQYIEENPVRWADDCYFTDYCSPEKL